MAIIMRSLLLLAIPALAACAQPAQSPEVVTKKELIDFDPFGSDSAPASGTGTGPVLAPSTKEAAITNAMKVLKDNLCKLVSDQKNQSIVGGFAFVFGMAALLDGRFFFKNLVLIAVAVFFFCFALSQLESTWTGPTASKVKYVASIEFGLFMGLVFFQGWEGTQLLFGLVVGMYLFRTVQAVTLMSPYFVVAHESAIYKVLLCTFTVLAGSWAVHERYGAKRVLGLLAPLIGSSLVVATMSYSAMLGCSRNSKFTTHAFGPSVVVKPTDVPSVFQFWNMLAFPMHSEAVGIFTFAGKSLVLHGHIFSYDRMIGIFFWVVIFFLGMRFQLKNRPAQKLSSALDTVRRASNDLRIASERLDFKQ